MENTQKTIRVYTTQDVCKIVGVSEQRIHQMRSGQNTSRINKHGVKKTNFRKPILIENEDWEWLDSEVVFFPSAIQKAINRRKRPDLSTRTPSSSENDAGSEIEITENN